MNGSLTLTETNFDSVALYSCDIGFELNGPSERLCQENGEWSENEPICESKAPFFLIRMTFNNEIHKYNVL